MSLKQALPGKQTGRSQRLRVWYDSECPLCRTEIDLLKRLDSKQTINFMKIEGCSTLPIAKEQLLERLHAQQPDGEIVSGAEAFAAIWRKLPGLKMLGYVAQWKPAGTFLEWLYGKFLKHRAAMQQWLSRRGIE
ncbi:MAG: DUF393 domain-containing protein [Candidatus Thiodiazotropha sp. (ex. Lucinisca nassula)]|nr:DUF393 domain-containing protein [Candidatus Thiodiazotropha sp. (ex. Lucinisca nassula)]MBW9269051.1 DUF393 domain-containing protein [Candidatus Thiodiazotropha sp. (ex. Lucinisca nassula)]